MWAVKQMFSLTTCGVALLRLGMKSIFPKRGHLCCHWGGDFFTGTSLTSSLFFKMETEEVHCFWKLMWFLLRDLQMAYFNMPFQFKQIILLYFFFSYTDKNKTEDSSLGSSDSTSVSFLVHRDYRRWWERAWLSTWWGFAKHVCRWSPRLCKSSSSATKFCFLI